MTIDQLIQDSTGTTGATVQQTAVISKSLADRLTKCANDIGVRKSQIQAVAIGEACDKIESAVADAAKAEAREAAMAAAMGKAAKKTKAATVTAE
jgi:hypothetical protein